MEEKIIQARSFWPIIKIKDHPAIYYKVRTIELADYPYEYSRSDWYFLNKPITSYLVVEIDSLDHLKNLDLELHLDVVEEDSIIIDLRSKQAYINETEAIGIQLSNNVDILNFILNNYKIIETVGYDLKPVLNN